MAGAAAKPGGCLQPLKIEREEADDEHSAVENGFVVLVMVVFRDNPPKADRQLDGRPRGAKDRRH